MTRKEKHGANNSNLILLRCEDREWFARGTVFLNSLVRFVWWFDLNTHQLKTNRDFNTTPYADTPQIILGTSDIKQQQQIYKSKRLPPGLWKGKACFPQVLVFHQMAGWSQGPMDRHAPHIPVTQTYVTGSHCTQAKNKTPKQIVTK